MSISSPHAGSNLFAQTGDLTSFDSSEPIRLLGRQLRHEAEPLVALVRETTSFNLTDCTEIVEAAIKYVEEWSPPLLPNSGSIEVSGRDLKLKAVPWGTVAAILPQNAFLTVALNVILNGVCTGNSVVIRPPTASAKLGRHLAEMVALSGFPDDVVKFVSTDAQEFLFQWEYSDRSVLLHFMGSSERGPDLLNRSWTSGQPVLIDGTGNSWVYIDGDQDPMSVAEIVWSGAIRYNGETCTSANGAIVHPSIALAVRKKLIELLAETSFGTAEHHKVGPLFTATQAAWCDRQIAESGAKVLRHGSVDGALFPPIIALEPKTDSDLVRKGLFGPGMWLLDGDWDYFLQLWKTNAYPLCAGIFSRDMLKVSQAQKLARASRIVVNGDPSLEDPLEPWGAYPPSGQNPVGPWHMKYLRFVQVDQPAS